MTVIAYRDGLMAADSMESETFLYVGTVDKICRSPDGAVGASSGRAGDGDRFRLWMESGRHEVLALDAGPGDFAALLVLPGRKVCRMDHKGYVFPAAQAEFYAEGCGRDVALGAMAYGASAVEAVLIATKFVPYCVLPCHTGRVD